MSGTFQCDVPQDRIVVRSETPGFNIVSFTRLIVTLTNSFERGSVKYPYAVLAKPRNVHQLGTGTRCHIAIRRASHANVLIHLNQFASASLSARDDTHIHNPFTNESRLTLGGGP